MAYRFDPQHGAVLEQWEPLIEFPDGTEPIMILKTVPGEIPLEAMERARTESEAAIAAWCLEVCLGVDGWKRLRALKGLPRGMVQSITELCRQKVFGPVEEEGKG